jgi:hypothetical protein
MMQDQNTGIQRLWLGYLGLVFLAGLYTLVSIILIPGDTKNAWVFGFSTSRLLMIVLASVSTVLVLWGVFRVWRKPVWALELNKRVAKLLSKKATFIFVSAILLSLSIFTLWCYRFVTKFVDTGIGAYVQRVAPFLLLLSLVSVLTFLLIFLLLRSVYLGEFVTPTTARLLRDNLLVVVVIPYGLPFIAILIYLLTLRVPWPNERLPFAYYALCGLFPLTMYLVRGRKELETEIAQVWSTLLERFREHGRYYALSIAGFSILFLGLAFLHIPMLDDRVWRFAIHNTPFWLRFWQEPPLYLQLSYLIHLVLPIEIVSPFISLTTILCFFLFLVYINGGEKPSYVFLTLIVAFAPVWALLYTYYSNLEIPAAMFGFIGLFAIMRKKYSLGFLAFLYSLTFKVTAFFYVFVGVVVIVYHLVQDWKNIKKLNLSLILIGIAFMGMNYWPLTKYILGRGGPGYIITTSYSLFWITPFFDFLEFFFLRLLSLTLFAVVGFFSKNKYSRLAVVAMLLLLFFRNFSRLSELYYPLFFVPPLAFLAYQGIVHLDKVVRKKGNLPRGSVVVLVVLVAVAYFFYSGTMVNQRVINRTNSNLISLAGELSANHPKPTRILQRGISLEPYFDRNGATRDVDHLYPNSRQEFFVMLPEQGCVIWLSRKLDLEFMEISEAEFYELGFYDFIPLPDRTEHLRDGTGRWIMLQRDCD